MVIIRTNDSDYLPVIHNIAKKGIKPLIINFQVNLNVKLKKLRIFISSMII